MSDLNTDRLVRSAISGSAGEPYCCLILDSLGVGDYSHWSLDDIHKFWDDAGQSDLTVLRWTNCFKKMESCEPEWREMYKWSEEDKHQLHEMAWQLVQLTRPEDFD